MSQLLINQYFNRLSRLRQITGADRETQVRAAFQRLLENWGDSKKLTFVSSVLPAEPDMDWIEDFVAQVYSDEVTNATS